MNLREGMRRVGIVLGALGCVAGGAFGYWNLQNVWRSLTRFERLQALPVMLDVNAAIKEYRETPEIDISAGLIPKTSQSGKHKDNTVPQGQAIEGLPPGAIVRPIPKDAQQTEHGPWEDYAPGPKQEFTNIRPIPQAQAGGQGAIQDKAPKYTIEPPETVTITPDWGTPVHTAQAASAYDKAVADDPAAEITVDAKGTDGIQTVNADKAGAISSIQLTTGEWVRRGSKTLKARLAFIASLLLPFCYPVIGFLVPWGTIRVFIWVAGGFSAPQSSS